MTIKDDLNTVIANQAKIEAAIAAIPASTGGAPTDLTPVINAVSAVQTDVTAIKAEFTATPTPSPAA